MAGKNHRSIPGLEALLRTKMGNDLIVENHTATEFLAPGENYGSLILKVDAVIRRKGKDSKSEELHMVAKLPPLLKWQRDLFNSPQSFGKEAFFYETILPAYKEMERKCGVKEEDIFDVGAEFYGARLNLQFGDDFDDNAVLLLENLKVRGYYSGSRINGMDIDYSRAAVKTLARFHAIGIAIKNKNPDLFEVLKDRCESIMGEQPEGTPEVMKAICRSVKEDPVIAEHYDACVKLLGNGPCIDYSAAAERPWSTIIHADLWVTNILFLINKTTALPDDVKFVDFQNYLVQSPLRDLSFLLGMICDHQVSTKNIPELIDLYHKHLVSRLKMMDCDVSPYSRDQFDQQLAKDALLEFSHITFMLKVTMVDDDPNVPKSENPTENLSRPGSKAFRERLRDLVSGYAKRGWF